MERIQEDILTKISVCYATIGLPAIVLFAGTTCQPAELELSRLRYAVVRLGPIFHVLRYSLGTQETGEAKDMLQSLSLAT